MLPVQVLKLNRFLCVRWFCASDGSAGDEEEQVFELACNFSDEDPSISCLGRARP